MTPQQIFLAAAQDIHDGLENFSCSAIYYVGGGKLVPEYARLASPMLTRSLCMTDIEQAVGRNAEHPKARAFRVLLLLMIRAAYDDIKGDPKGNELC